ncbi:MAG: phosphoglycerate kinase [Oligoflexia bacterium]|nr:phosphoglycerate kinase [Oligoflexia bacterium]MBF0364545.1 phosphoglycerate kinase [Oligoflexia bacterium]
MALKYVDEVSLQGKRVVARFDFNVPIKNEKITDTTRIDSALPTINHLLKEGVSKLILMSHLGRPDGKRVAKYSLKLVGDYLAAKLNTEVILTESATDGGIKQLLALPKVKVVLLENLRFHPEEEENDPEFCKILASYGDVYVNDAFGTSHRKHASTYGIVQYFKDRAYGGFLLKQEVQALTKITETPTRPFVAIVGGAKISDKIKTIERLIVAVDHLLIGGAMAYPFLKAQGKKVAKSLCSDNDFELAKKILQQSSAPKMVLPIDHIVADSPEGQAQSCTSIDIPEGMMGFDIGPKSVALFKEKLATAKTIFWNGPMGMFETEAFSKGTMDIARALADIKAFTLIGGGDSVSAINKSGVASKISHISTGGGASLEFIEQGELPGIQALKFGL